MLAKFQGLATSGHHTSATITDRRKFTTKLTHHGMFSYHFFHLNQFSLSSGLYI